MSLRAIITDIILCTEDVEGSADEGMLTSLWREESGDHRGRRYSTLAEAKKNDPFHQIRLRGANPGTVGRSLFAFPGYIRDMARSGLTNLWVLDIVNCHLSVMHRRHPSLEHLAHYVERREEVLSSLPCHRAAAKLLFIRLLYGGTVAGWCAENGLEPARLPEFVSLFEADLRQAQKLDLASDMPQSKGSTQHLLNTGAERKAIDAIGAHAAATRSHPACLRARRLVLLPRRRLARARASLLFGLRVPSDYRAGQVLRDLPGSGEGEVWHRGLVPRGR